MLKKLINPKTLFALSFAFGIGFGGTAFLTKITQTQISSFGFFILGVACVIGFTGVGLVNWIATESRWFGVVVALTFAAIFAVGAFYPSLSGHIAWQSAGGGFLLLMVFLSYWMPARNQANSSPSAKASSL